MKNDKRTKTKGRKVAGQKTLVEPPLALRLILGQAAQGAGKTRFEHWIREWDWQPEARELAEEIPHEKIADALVEKFLRDCAGGAFAHAIHTSWNEFCKQTVDVLNSKLGPTNVWIDETSFSVEYEGEADLFVQCDAWGDLADEDNPDEGANFDRCVDGALRQLFGHEDLQITHDFSRGGVNEQLYFVWRVRVHYRFDPGAVIRNVATETLALIQKLAESATANATL